jgi:vitamin B12/bleomycin/antimicrobial peptide transport system ATP-binding/permease protein
VNINIFDRQLWEGFWKIARLYWFSDEKWKARGVLAVLLLLLFSFSVMNVILSYVGRDFMTALSEKKSSDFYRNMFLYLGVFVVATPVSVCFSYVSRRLGVNWREWLTNHFLGRYFDKRAYYHIDEKGKIDNPDQRISQDISSFTVNSLDFLSILIFSTIQFVSFVGILWSISIPLVAALLLYAVVGTGGTLFFGKKLINLNFLQLRKEADLRYGLVHVRDNAESIAFYQGEEREASQVSHRVRNVISNLGFLIGWQRNLGFFTKGYEYLILVLPFAIMAPLYFSGQIKFGVVTQAAGAFSQVLGALSVIVSQFEQLGAFAAGVTRIQTFSDALDDPSGRSGSAGLPTIESVREPRLAVEHLTLQTPDYRHTLFEDLSLSVPPGEGLLVVGASGTGKSSLLRAVAGLWDSGTGKVVHPPLGEMMFLPQRPYMILGSLRDQLLYPHLDSDVTGDDLLKVLDRVRLKDLPDRVGGFDAEMDWGHLLSLGEQQRLAFARLLLTNPRYAVLDEATSALDLVNEAHLYAELQATGSTYVSVGHRPTLVSHHNQVLELQGERRWRLVAAADFRGD